jgi:uncharacterized protein YbjT (DUF2867 family)
MYLVIGATGNVGGGVVKQLLDKRHEVRPLVRDASRAELLPEGASFAVGDPRRPG